VITIAPPLTEGESTPEATSEGAANTPQEAILTAGRWQNTTKWLDCNRPSPDVVPHDINFEVDQNSGALITNWDQGNIVDWIFERVEDGVYRFVNVNELYTQTITVTILSPDHFTMVTNYSKELQGECHTHLDDYVLVSAGG
jgi:hypothetical protein